MQLRFHFWQGIAAFLVGSSMLITGCSSVPQSAPPVADASDKLPSATPSGRRALPVLPPAGSGRGGYYQDDGPGDAPPDGLHDLPDAVPVVEPYPRRGNRPYVVFGKSYKPFTDGRPFRQRGIGSWYGKKFHGQRTSSGEIYDMYKMTGAHPTLPLPSYVRVTNISNGRQVIVRINDRGPFHSERIIDLSYAAALKLGYIAKGRTELEVERLLPDEIARINSAREVRSEQSASVAQPVAAMPLAESAQSMPMVGADTDIANVPAVEQPPGAVTPVKVTGSAATGGVYLQLGAYGSAANADSMHSRLVQTWNRALPPLEVVQNAGLYRIYSGPFGSRSEAEFAARQIQNDGTVNPVIVRR